MQEFKHLEAMSPPIFPTLVIVIFIVNENKLELFITFTCSNFNLGKTFALIGHGFSNSTIIKASPKTTSTAAILSSASDCQLLGLWLAWPL